MRPSKVFKFYVNCNKTICSECGGSGCVTVELDDDGEQTCKQECAVCGGTGYED